MLCWPVVSLRGSSQISIKYRNICLDVNRQTEEKIDRTYNHYQTYIEHLQIINSEQIVLLSMFFCLFDGQFKYHYFIVKLYKQICQKMFTIDSVDDDSCTLKQVPQLFTVSRYDSDQEIDSFLNDFEDEEHVGPSFRLKVPLQLRNKLSVPSSTPRTETYTTEGQSINLFEQYHQCYYSPLENGDLFGHEQHQSSNQQSQEDNMKEQDKKEVTEKVEDNMKEQDKKEVTEKVDDNMKEQDKKEVTEKVDDPPPQSVAIRNDGHNISQNLSSKLITSVAKLLSNKNKQMKEKIKKQVKEFLKNCHGYNGNGLNGQLTLLFIYLFLLQNNASSNVYQIMHKQITIYLHKKDLQAERKSLEQKQSLQLKIRANLELAQILFKDKHDSPLDFNEIQSVCHVLFGGRQKSGLRKNLDKAEKVYKNLTGTVSLDRSQTNSLQIHTQFRYQ